jgi:tRNA(Arg) A34 adenosine deaminase TadA
MKYKDLSFEWQVCFGMARGAFEHGSLPIGCLIVDKDGKHIARASAAMVYGSKKTNMTQHAEIEALAKIPVPELEQRLTMYSTVEPCPMCFGAVNVARISELHYGTRDPWAGSTGLVNGNWYMQRKHIDIKTGGAFFERVLASWLVYAWSRKPDGGLLDMNNEFIERWKMILPDAVPMAHRLAKMKWGAFAHDGDLFQAISDTVEEVDGNV